jgi:predicted aspartyl protease
MAHAVFDDNTPLVQISIGWEYAIQSQFFILDTGFTGDIQLTPKMAQELGLEVISVAPMEIANGEVADMPVALGVALIDGQQKAMEVLISKGAPLAGIGFLSKFNYKVTLDCRRKTIKLEKVL